MALTPTQVRHIARLCRLKLSDDEVERYTRELTSILAFVDELGSVNTQGIEPTIQVTGLRCPLREDALRAGDRTDPDVLLACSGLPIVDHMIETPHAHDQ